MLYRSLHYMITCDNGHVFLISNPDRKTFKIIKKFKCDYYRRDRKYGVVCVAFKDPNRAALFKLLFWGHSACSQLKVDFTFKSYVDFEENMR